MTRRPVATGTGPIERRTFLRGAGLIAASLVGFGVGACTNGDGSSRQGRATSTTRARSRRRSNDAPLSTLAEDLQEMTIADLQGAMGAGAITAEALVEAYLERIEALDGSGPRLKSIIETNPDALAIARDLDTERASAGTRGPLHGIPVLLKDNIDTADALQTTAGSLALEGSRPAEDSTVARRLREAGTVILGKTNLSEWANFRSRSSTSGWSARGGQTKNPYVLDRNPCGSSSGSGVAVSANLAVVALGTETFGSIVCPAQDSGVVGIKPTVGLTSRAGVIPISYSQDTVGPMTRTVADAAIVLSSLVGADPRDPATSGSTGNLSTDYTQFLDPNGLNGARIGVERAYDGYDPDVDAVMTESLAAIEAAGATLVDPGGLPNLSDIDIDIDMFEVLTYEFRAAIAEYLETRVPDTRFGAARRNIPRDLRDLIRFNSAHADEELRHFGQDIFEYAASQGTLADDAYRAALDRSTRLGGEDGIDAAIAANGLDAVVAPTGGPAGLTDYDFGDQFLFSSDAAAARAGYPLITVPAGFAGELPLGLTFMGPAYSEPTLIRLAFAFEQATQARRKPSFLETID